MSERKHNDDVLDPVEARRFLWRRSDPPPEPEPAPAPPAAPPQTTEERVAHPPRALLREPADHENFVLLAFLLGRSASLYWLKAPSKPALPEHWAGLLLDRYGEKGERVLTSSWSATRRCDIGTGGLNTRRPCVPGSRPRASRACAPRSNAPSMT